MKRKTSSKAELEHELKEEACVPLVDTEGPYRVLTSGAQLSAYVISKVGLINGALVGMTLDWQYPQDSVAGLKHLDKARPQWDTT